MGTTARSVAAPSQAFCAYPFSAATSCLIDNGGTLINAPAATRGSSTTTFLPHQQQALAAAPPSGMRGGGVGLQQQLSNVLEDHHNLLIDRIRKELFENPSPPPLAPPAPLAPPLIYSLFQDTSTLTRLPNSEYYY
jgi:hypothetical protein